jgi:AMMECR1 domain-containing protein
VVSSTRFPVQERTLDKVGGNPNTVQCTEDPQFSPLEIRHTEIAVVKLDAQILSNVGHHTLRNSGKMGCAGGDREGIILSGKPHQKGAISSLHQ